VSELLLGNLELGRERRLALRQVPELEEDLNKRRAAEVLLRFTSSTSRSNGTSWLSNAPRHAARTRATSSLKSGSPERSIERAAYSRGDRRSVALKTAAPCDRHANDEIIATGGR
jgi:hypothetical protein